MERTPKQAGAIVAARRRELGVDVAELARDAQVDVKTIRSLETGERMPRDSTKAKLERALEWTPGSIDLVFAGEVPIVIETPPASARTETYPPAVTVTGTGTSESSAAGTARIVSREYRLLTSQLEVTEALLDAVEVAHSPVEVEYALKYLGFADKMLELIARGAPLVTGDEAEEVNVRTVHASTRFATQRYRLGLPITVSTGDLRPRVDGTLAAMTAASADVAPRAEAFKERYEDPDSGGGGVLWMNPTGHEQGPDRWPNGEPVYDEHWEQWKAWQAAGAPVGAWEAFRASDVQQAHELVARFVEGPTDAERLHGAQDDAATAPDPEGPEGGA